jgi:hypothetical protein
VPSAAGVTAWAEESSATDTAATESVAAEMISADGIALHAAADVDTTRVRPGQPLRLRVRVTHPASMRVQFPDPEEDPFPGFSARVLGDMVQAEADSGRVESRLDYRLVAHVLDTTLVIPALAIPLFDGATGVKTTGSGHTLPDVAITESIAIDLVGVIPAEEAAQAEPKPERPPIALQAPWPWKRILFSALLALLATWMLWRWWQRRRLRGATAEGYFEPLEPPRPAHEVALERLAELAASPLAKQGPAKAFYTAATDILRDYLRGRFGVDARDLTTEELLAATAGLELPGRSRNLLRAVLKEADLVKFARVEPPWSEWSGVIKREREVVESTVPTPPASIEASSSTGTQGGVDSRSREASGGGVLGAATATSAVNTEGAENG